MYVRLLIRVDVEPFQFLSGFQVNNNTATHLSNIRVAFNSFPDSSSIGAQGRKEKMYLNFQFLSGFQLWIIGEAVVFG